jgi:hypothetical protein
MATHKDFFEWVREDFGWHGDLVRFVGFDASEAGDGVFFVQFKTENEVYSDLSAPDWIKVMMDFAGSDWQTDRRHHRLTAPSHYPWITPRLCNKLSIPLVQNIRQAGCKATLLI